MRKIITTDITTLASMPVKSGTITHIQNAYTELINNTAASLVGKPYGAIGQFALIGCNNIDTLPDVDIQAGFILYNGTIYEVDAVAFTPGGGQVAVATIATTYFSATNADPVEFTDGNNHNVHEIKKIVFSSAVSGSGIFDYSALSFVQIQAGTEVTYDTGWGDGGFESTFYRKNRDGLVTVQGRFAANGTPADTDQIFALPIGFRPTVDTYVTGTRSDAGGDSIVKFLIQPSGRVFAFVFGVANYTNNDAFIISAHFYNS